MEESEPVFGARMLLAGADRLVERIVRSGGAELDPVGLPEAADRLLVEDHLGDRREFHLRQLLGRALVARVEASRPVQRIAEEVEPDRAALARRPDVDDPAADRVIARFHDRRRLHETHPDEEGAKRLLVDPVLHARGEGRLPHGVARWNLLGRRVQRGQEREPLRHGMGQRRERRHAGRGDVGVGAHPIVREAVPCREGEDRQPRIEEGERRLHRRKALVVACDMEDRPGTTDLVEHKPGVEAFGGAAQGDLFRLGHDGRQVTTPIAVSMSTCPG